MGFSRIVQLKGKLICFVYCLISVISLYLMVSVVTDDLVSNKTMLLDYTLVVVYLPVVSFLAFISHGDKKDRWVLAYLVVGLCDGIAKKMIKEEPEQLAYYYLICYLTIFVLMQISLFMENDPTGFTHGAAIGFFFRLFITFILCGWEMTSQEALHAAAVAAVAILAKVTEASDEPAAYVVEEY